MTSHLSYFDLVLQQISLKSITLKENISIYQIYMPHAHTSIINVFVHSVIDDLWLFLLRHIFYLSINFYDLLLLLV